MKKILSLLLVLAMVFCFAACGDKQQASVASPMVEYESLEAMNDAYGFNMKKPPVMGVSDESFAAIEVEGQAPIAQYKFSVNGTEYTMRASANLGDISGVYSGKSTLFADLADGDGGVVSTDEYRGARWYTIDGQYCLVTGAKDVDADKFAAVFEELESLMVAKALEFMPKVEEIIGEYADKFSQRASLEVTPSEADAAKVHLMINWGSSAAEMDVWEMDGKFAEDGLFYYEDGTHSKITFKEDGTEEKVETIADKLSGYFSFNKETKELSWDGAPEEDCRECVFEAY